MPVLLCCTSDEHAHLLAAGLELLQPYLYAVTRYGIQSGKIVYILSSTKKIRSPCLSLNTATWRQMMLSSCHFTRSFSTSLGHLSRIRARHVLSRSGERYVWPSESVGPAEERPLREILQQTSKGSDETSRIEHQSDHDGSVHKSSAEFDKTHLSGKHKPVRDQDEHLHTARSGLMTAQGKAERLLKSSASAPQIERARKKLHVYARLLKKLDLYSSRNRTQTRLQYIMIQQDFLKGGRFDQWSTEIIFEDEDTVTHQLLLPETCAAEDPINIMESKHLSKVDEVVLEPEMHGEDVAFPDMSEAGEEEILGCQIHEFLGEEQFELDDGTNWFGFRAPVFRIPQITQNAASSLALKHEITITHPDLIEKRSNLKSTALGKVHGIMQFLLEAERKSAIDNSHMSDRLEHFTSRLFEADYRLHLFEEALLPHSAIQTELSLVEALATEQRHSGIWSYTDPSTAVDIEVEEESLPDLNPPVNVGVVSEYRSIHAEIDDASMEDTGLLEGDEATAAEEAQIWLNWKETDYRATFAKDHPRVAQKVLAKLENERVRNRRKMKVRLLQDKAYIPAETVLHQDLDADEANYPSERDRIRDQDRNDLWTFPDEDDTPYEAQQEHEEDQDIVRGYRRFLPSEYHTKQRRESSETASQPGGLERFWARQNAWDEHLRLQEEAREADPRSKLSYEEKYGLDDPAVVLRNAEIEILERLLRTVGQLNDDVAAYCKNMDQRPRNPVIDPFFRIHGGAKLKRAVHGIQRKP